MATVLEKPTTSEIDIWHSAVKGDTKAFEQIVVSHQSAVSAVAFNIVGDFATSQDIAQETFWAAWNSRANLRDTKRLGAWLCGIARNLARQWKRTRSRRKEVSSEKFGSEFDSYSTNPADDFVSKEEESIVWSALEKIPENYREVLVLYYRHDQSIGEVAKSLGISNDAARQRLSRGRQILRSRVENIVEGVLDRTNPSRTFTSRVMAGIVSAGVATSSSTAKAGVAVTLNSSTATTAATLAKVVSGGSMLGMIGGTLGSIGGLLGAWFGTWLPAQLASTETERQLLLERGRLAMKACFIFAATTFAWTLAMMTFRNAWVALAIFYAIANLAFIVGISIHGFRTQKLVKRLRAELSPVEDPNQSKIGTKVRKFTEQHATVYFGRRYTSKLSLLGLPLVDIQVSDPQRMMDVSPKPMKVRSAKGWIAIGDTATGLIALGGRTLGVISIGGMASGVVAIGGMSIGLISFGGLAIGGFALGGLAIGYEAIGGGAVGWHSATGGGAVAWHAAAGGGALAHDFAVGGGAWATEVNTNLANQVIDETCHLGLLKNHWPITIAFVVFSFLATPLTRLLYTTTPPEQELK
jgi:RNA polymerase sigma factor (sigma-70 family)